MAKPTDEHKKVREGLTAKLLAKSERVAMAEQLRGCCTSGCDKQVILDYIIKIEEQLLDLQADMEIATRARKQVRPPIMLTVDALAKAARGALARVEGPYVLNGSQVFGYMMREKLPPIPVPVVTLHSHNGHINDVARYYALMVPTTILTVVEHLEWLEEMSARYSFLLKEGVWEYRNMSGEGLDTAVIRDMVKMGE